MPKRLRLNEKSVREAPLIKGWDYQVFDTDALKPGTRLMREWNGRTYQVEVVLGGFVMEGRTYRSLSAIAKHITGAHWSGPRFFGI